MITRIPAVAGLLAAVLLAGAIPLRAQSLGDIARKEEKRRETIKKPAKVYTNKDLGPTPESTATPPRAAAPAATDASQPARDEKQKDAAKDKEPAKDQAYWAGRLKELKAAIDRDQTYAEALQSRINALATDFVNRDDPAQRAVIERDRQKALAELDRLKKQIVTDKKSIDDLQEEARRAGVPPGWLRS